VRLENEWGIVRGAHAISFRPDDGLVILTARKYNEASFAPRTRVKRPSRDQPHGVPQIGRLYDQVMFNNNNNDVTIIIASLPRRVVYVLSLIRTCYSVRGGSASCESSLLSQCRLETNSISFEGYEKLVSCKHYVVIA